MSDVLVEEKACHACGVGVRTDTQFCYNCGASLDEEAPIAAPGGEPAAVIADITSKDSSPDPSVRNGETTESTREPMRSAASLRRRSRGGERKPVEVTWEPAGGANVVLIVTTILLLLFSAAIVSLALYYR